MRRLVSVVALLAVVGLLVGVRVAHPAQAASRDQVTIFAGSPTTLDPVLQSDIGSAFFSAQLYESLTALDLNLELRPALARSWDVSADGRRIVFHLRPGLTFSDGSPLSGQDVVGSWLRIIDPRQPSQLASLFMDVRGAADYLAGRTTDRASVGVSATGLDVTVDLVRPGSDFPAIVASPTFAIVPAAVWRDGRSMDTGSVPGSGAYVVGAITSAEMTLRANDRYWAGAPSVRTVHLLSSIGGQNPVAAFQAGDVDYVAISSLDAPWIQYDRELGPQLRLVPSLSVQYLGFTTDRPPFDDVRVRQAFGAAVDWARLGALGGSVDQVPADSMVPPGIPGAGAGSWLPAHDPAKARLLLGAAGYPGGAGFPVVTFATDGLTIAEGIAADLRRELGVTVRLEQLSDHFGRLHEDPPPIWSLGWVADYPGANDFLGVLLETGSSNNYGHWSSPTFDAGIAAALASRDPATATAGFRQALGVLRDQVPVVPLLRGDGWALSRDGLLGADENGLGIMRLAGLAWR
jgi:oligopeptide transport system substrate-binding protein